MLSHVRRDDGVAAGYPVDLFHNVRTGERPLVIVQRIFPLQFCDMCHPLFMGLPGKLFVQLREHFLQIPHKRNVCLDVFVDLRRIHVDMQHLRVLREFLRISHHPV